MRAASKAKHHFFVDVPIVDCLKPIEEEKLKSGSGTKLLITLGPSCHEVETLVQMLEAGVTCARVDLTWGTYDFHRRSMANLAAAMRETRRLCSVWLDTMGREMVVRRKFETDSKGWPLHGSSLRAEEGQTITITTDVSVEASSTTYPINYPSFPSMVQPGQVLQVGRYLSTGADGGSLYLKVVDTTSETVVCEASNSASLDGLLTVMVCHRNSGGVDSSADLELPLLTEYDMDCIKRLGQEFEIDFISLSYCNSARDVYECRALLDSLHMTQTKIVAKIERKAGIVNFAGIAEAADGVILSRGNLGLDFDPEIMAILQKQVITKCNHMGKPIILTRIVDTMVNAPRPTRAEATDVANAVLDGADGLMLGAETLRGMYPVLTAEMVLKLAASAEERFDYREHHEALVTEQFDDHPAPFTRGSSGDLHSPDMYGLSPTAQWGHASYFAPTTTSHPGNGHMSYTASAAYLGHPPLPPTLSSEGDLQGSHQGNGGATDSDADPQPFSKYRSSFGNLNLLAGMKRSESAEALRRARAGMAQVLKLESIASSAVRTAEKINAGLILVMTQTGRTASLVAKYRPPMPVLAVVVPTLKSDGLGWRMEGKFLARQCLIIRGVVPMLAAPMSEGNEDLLNEAIFLATNQKLCAPSDYVVCIQSSRGALTFKVVQVNDQGTGIRTMYQGNSLISNEEPDIVSDSSPFEAANYKAWTTGRRFSRGLSFRARKPTSSDATTVFTEGSMQAGALHPESSLDLAK